MGITEVDFHIGGHTFVVCGFDGKDTVLASDINQTASGVKKGFYAPISLEQLRTARSSSFKPFPPKNLWLQFNFAGFHKPSANDIVEAIAQTVDAHLNPPIKNFGVSGMRHAANQILKWPDLFSEHALRMNLFNLYIFIEIGGTGGGCFRPMFARFLNESAAITGNRAFLKSADSFEKIGHSFSRIALMFKDAATMKGLRGAILAASKRFRELAEKEEEEYAFLEKNLHRELQTQ